MQLEDSFMPPRDEKKTFVEVRVYVADPNQKPADLSLVTGSLLLAPKQGAPLKKDLQLMMPDPPQGAPDAEPRVLPDGHAVRATAVEFSGPFQRDSSKGGPPSVYFKADVPSELARKETSATLTLHFPAGKQKVELPSLFPR
jgi:hypothetical protein